MEIKPIDLRSLDEHVANTYEGVIVAARQARRLNEELRLEYSTLINTIPAKGVEDEAEDVENPDQLKVSLEFEKRPKPHVKALNQLLDGEIDFRYKTE